MFNILVIHLPTKRTKSDASTVSKT